MKRVFCFFISILFLMYFGCFVQKSSESLPTATEFIEYVDERKDSCMKAYEKLKDFIIKHDNQSSSNSADGI